MAAQFLYFLHSSVYVGRLRFLFCVSAFSNGPDEYTYLYLSQLRLLYFWRISMYEVLLVFVYIPQMNVATLDPRSA